MIVLDEYKSAVGDKVDVGNLWPTKWFLSVHLGHKYKASAIGQQWLANQKMLGTKYSDKHL